MNEASFVWLGAAGRAPRRQERGKVALHGRAASDPPPGQLSWRRSAGLDLLSEELAGGLMRVSWGLFINFFAEKNINASFPPNQDTIDANATLV